jgi:Putative zinc-finger
MTARYSCAERIHALPWYAAGRVTADERALVEAHLAGCARCRDELAQWRAVGAALAREEAQTAPGRTSAEGWMSLSERIQALDPPRRAAHFPAPGADSPAASATTLYRPYRPIACDETYDETYDEDDDDYAFILEDTLGETMTTEHDQRGQHTPDAARPHTGRRNLGPRATAIAGVAAALILVIVATTIYAQFARRATSSVTAAATATSTPAFTTVAPGTVLFQSDWSKGLDGWGASDGWTVRDGMLEIDGQDNRTLTIPYKPTVRDYAVIYSVQVVDEPKDGGYFRLVAAPTSTAPGFHAEVQGLHTDLEHPNGDHPHAWALLDPSDTQETRNVHTTDYEPHHVMWTYRVEVRGNGVLFKRNDASLSAAVASKPGSLSHGPLRIECGLAFLRFGQIQIIAL